MGERDTALFDAHVFAGHARRVFCDLGEQARHAERMGKALLDVWWQVCENVPPAWRYVDPEQTVLTDFDLNATENMLELYQTDSFWQVAL